MSLGFHKFVNWFLEQLYGSLAFIYNPVAFIVSRGDWHLWNHQMKRFLNKNEKILEVGIGTGLLLKKLHEEGFSITGCDRSSQMLRNNFRDNGRKQFNIIRGDNNYLPFASTSFHKIIATFPSKYIFSKDFLEENRRLLIDGGELIVLMSVVFSQKGFLSFLYRALFRITGQSLSKEETERTLNSLYCCEKEINIVWIPYNNVELCFLKIKN
jgi:ubiquinone/menaquinone biosynthesis C-methylase UbiE